MSSLERGGWVWLGVGEGPGNPWGTPIPHPIHQALGGSDLVLLPIIIFTKSAATGPGSSAIIITLSLLLIIPIISVNYKQARHSGWVGGGRATSGRAWG